MNKLNKKAAKWWANRFQIEDKRDEFEAALLRRLPRRRWETYCDYDPWGILLDAVRDVTECAGFCNSSRGILPRKTGLRRVDNKLLSKEGCGAEWIEVE